MSETPGSSRRTEAPAAEQVAAGLWAIAMPMPNNPLGSVFVYAFELDGGGVLLVDAGWAVPGALEALEAGLAVADVAVEDVRGVALTHVHPDHFGLAGMIAERSGAWVGAHPLEAALVHGRYEETGSLLADVEAWLRAAGTPDDEVAGLTSSSVEVLPLVSSAPPFRIIEDGDLLDAPGWQLTAMHTPGHSPGHLCFHDAGRRLIATGDHVLPRITPNVSFHPQSDPDPLNGYLAALDRVVRLGPLLGLPGHGAPMHDTAGRARELARHHERQLDAVRSLVTDGCDTAYAVAARFPWRRPWARITGHMRRAAIGEAYAHLLVLERRDVVTRRGDSLVRWLPATDPKGAIEQ